MYNEDSRDASRSGGFGRLLSKAPLKLALALGAAALMLFVAAGTGGTKSALAYNSAPVAQGSHVLADNCYNGVNGYGYGWNGFYGYNGGSVFAPFNNGYFSGNPLYGNCYGYNNSYFYGAQYAYNYPYAYNNYNYGYNYAGPSDYTVYNYTGGCAAVPGVYSCNGYCGGGYGSVVACPQNCAQYACPPICTQSYSLYYGATVPCQTLPVDRISFVDAPSTLSCGVSADLVAQLWDAVGNPVADGTSVNFASSLGGAMATGTTTGGKAIVHITASTTPGLAQITASTGGVEGSTIIMIAC